MERSTSQTLLCMLERIERIKGLFQGCHILLLVYDLSRILYVYQYV
jgi:hypothetical protein